MLDPRIYRMGLIAVALAVIVLAFSLLNQQGPIGATLAPIAFSGGRAYTTMTSLAKRYPNRPPGSVADDEIAGLVAGTLRKENFFVSTTSFKAQTAEGQRSLETVTGVRPGMGNLATNGSIVIVAHRDALGAPATADASGTAVLLELARDLSGETQNRTVVLASTSGSIGASGAADLARQLSRPVDAVLVLGDLAGARVRQPVLVPWSNGQNVAPPMLRNTVASVLSTQAQLPSLSASLPGQFAHLAFPFTPTEQGPFAAQGEPAVLLSASGERSPAPGEPVDPARITTLGQTVLQTVNALDGGPSVPAPSTYLVFDRKVIPDWAIRLFVLALMLPVLGATLDGVARARRRGHRISPWVLWVLCAALPFVLAVLLGRALGLIGAVGPTPPAPVGADAIPLQTRGIAILASLACVILISLLALRPLVIRLTRAGVPWTVPERSSTGAAAGVLSVLCAVAFLMWLSNPFAAALLVPALHLWMWAVGPERRARRAILAALVVGGLAAPALVLAYWAMSLGLTPAGAAWNLVLMIAGGQVRLLTAVEWSIFLGCAVGSGLIVARAARQRDREDAPVTIRGPITYAGPGSLGGTESALRR
ncbi:MAG: M28 family peptidase [Solirubrobacterales bacterium]|nr:M28 family peptidase [Solirubrobacterales bacterium]